MPILTGPARGKWNTHITNTRHAGRLLAVATLLFLAAPAAAQETRSMDVLGTINAQVDGEQQREWLTIESGVEGMDGASAVWSPSALPPGVAAQLEGMSEQRRAAMDRMAAMMGGGNNPLATGEGRVDVRIVGFDPDAERMLREGMLSIEVTRLAADDIDAALGRSHEADISYFRNRGPATGLYVSAHKVGDAARVDFDLLELGDHGKAQGRFSATLCPISELMGRGEVDASKCVPISGEFTTDLKEEAPPASAS